MKKYWSFIVMVVVVVLLVRSYNTSSLLSLRSFKILSSLDSLDHVFYESKNNDGTISGKITIKSDHYNAFPQNIDDLFDFEDVPSGLDPRIERISGSQVYVYLDGKTKDYDRESTIMRVHYKGNPAFNSLGEMNVAVEIRFGHWQEMGKITNENMKDGETLGSPFELYAQGKVICIDTDSKKDVDENKIFEFQMGQLGESRYTRSILLGKSQYYDILEGEGGKSLALKFKSFSLVDKDFKTIKSFKKHYTQGFYDYETKQYYLLNESNSRVSIFDLNKFKFKHKMFSKEVSYIAVDSYSIFLVKKMNLMIFSKKNKLLTSSITFSDHIKGLYYDRSNNIVYVLLPKKIVFVSFQKESNTYGVVGELKTQISNPVAVVGDFRWGHVYVIDGNKNEIVIFHYMSH